jgi:hypothetical protein
MPDPSPAPSHLLPADHSFPKHCYINIDVGLIFVNINNCISGFSDFCHLVAMALQLRYLKILRLSISLISALSIPGLKMQMSCN